MTNYKWILFCAILLVGTACQQNQSNNETTATPQVPATPKTAEPVTPSAPTATTSVAGGAEVIQKTPLTEYAKQFYTKTLWRFEAAVVTNNLEKGKDFEGKWIKLNPDNTLTSGFYEEEGQTGSWALDEGTNVLTIVEGGERPVYSEWKVQTSASSDAIMIWVGTRRFGLNNTQIKLLTYNEKPVRK